MMPTPTLTVAAKRRPQRRDARTSPSHRRPRERSRLDSRDQRLLGRYTDRRGNAREVLARAGAAGSVLVLDRDRVTGTDLRLVAHLAADEPAENAALVCASYLSDTAVARHRCRALTDEDLHRTPFGEEPDLCAPLHEGSTSSGQPVDRVGHRYRLRTLQSGMSIPELRWWREANDNEAPAGSAVSVREAIGATESYEPVRTLTMRALSLNDGGKISTAVLRCELARVQRSPIVLNRRLREVVLETVTRDELSMSEIAVRCGRIKRDRKGNESGETSWLARRLGLLPEGGRHTPTPWIHSDVLALIARNGLGLSPHEVEL